MYKKRMFKKLEPLKKWCTKFYFSKVILGVGRIKKGIRIFDNNTLSIRDIGFLSLSYDHRVIDGADAARFLKELENLIENPSF